MGTALTRIEKEFILKTLVDIRAPLELRHRTERYTCTLLEVYPKTILLSMLTPLAEHAKKYSGVDVFFNFKGKRMTFKAKLMQIDNLRLTLSFPAGIYRDLSRKYDRIAAPEDTRISFVVQGERFELNFPKSESFEALDDESVAVGFDPTRIADLLRAFREKVRDFASENKIVMFRGRKPESFEENVVARTGRVLLYPFSYGQERETTVLSPKILTQEDIILAQTNEGSELFNVLAALSTRSADKEKKGILNEMYCPILYREYVAGYLYLVSFRRGGQKFGQKVIDYVLQFSRLLSYALKVNGYFRAAPAREKIDDAELIDISATGVLFCMNLQQYDSQFILLTDLPITISIAGRTIPVGGRIMRKYNDRGRLYLALHFIQIDEDDRLYLLDHLYGGTDRPESYASDEDWSL